MTVARVWAFLLASVLVVTVSVGCGDDPPNPFILAFDQPEVTITKETQFALVVKLSEPVAKKTHVDITNKHQGFVEFNPTVLLFKPGDEFKQGDDRQTTAVLGRKSTNDAFKDITFTIREANPPEVRTWRVKIRDN